jgi:hypothetical protein
MLKMQLDSYVALYNKNYSATETVSDLIPYLLEGFLKSDKGFTKASRSENSKTGMK